MLPQARRLARRLLADGAPDDAVTGAGSDETTAAPPAVVEAALFVLATTAEEVGEPVDAASRYAALATLAEQLSLIHI